MDYRGCWGVRTPLAQTINDRTNRTKYSTRKTARVSNYISSIVCNIPWITKTLFMHVNTYFEDSDRSDLKLIVLEGNESTLSEELDS